MAIPEAAAQTKIDFHFDPTCPLAWRTALWIREVRDIRPVDVTWRFFSLEVINRKEGTEPNYQIGNSWPALRTLALARRQGGNQGVEKMYLALGNAAHGRKEGIREPAEVEAALQKAGFDASMVNTAIADETTIEDVLADHQEAVRRYRAFGVPTIAIKGHDVGFYGPIIQFVPHGKEAGELWDYTAWALQQPNLFELKRDRSGVKWEAVTE